MIVDVLRNVNLFVDGRGYAGTVEEVNLPKLVSPGFRLRPSLSAFSIAS